MDKLWRGFVDVKVGGFFHFWVLLVQDLSTYDLSLLVVVEVEIFLHIYMYFYKFL